MKRLFISTVSSWTFHLLSLVPLPRTSLAPAPQTLVTVQPMQTASAAGTVKAPARGYLTDIFFTEGDRVKRGQLLAKLARPDGTPTYLMAPVAGRIGPARLQLGEYMAAYSTLAMIDISAVH